MVEYQLPKLVTGVRFPSLAPCIISALFIIFISGCATAPHNSGSYTEICDIQGVGQYHTVKSGETLWRIANRYGLDTETLLRANALKSSSYLEQGQVLIIPKVRRMSIVSTGATPEDHFMWPVKGDVISSFGAVSDKTKNKGIDIRAREGENILASRSGTVVFRDDKLKGFGKTVILDHGDNFQTVYAYNSEVLVRVGDSIRKNEVIARAGRTGRAKEPCLHFEIRKNGEPRNPYHYLR